MSENLVPQSAETGLLAPLLKDLRRKFSQVRVIRVGKDRLSGEKSVQKEKIKVSGAGLDPATPGFLRRLKLIT